MCLRNLLDLGWLKREVVDNQFELYTLKLPPRSGFRAFHNEYLFDLSDTRDILSVLCAFLDDNRSGYKDYRLFTDSEILTALDMQKSDYTGFYLFNMLNVYNRSHTEKTAYLITKLTSPENWIGGHIEMKLWD